jgi:hypothetical protein
VELSKEGVGKVHGLGDISEYEQDLLDACLKDLANNIKKVSPPPPSCNRRPPKRIPLRFPLRFDVSGLTVCRARNSLRITLELQKVVDLVLFCFVFACFIGVYLDRLTRYIVISCYLCNIRTLLDRLV